MHGVIGNAAAVGRNATSFRVLAESEPDIENASWHQIAGVLERIEAGHRSFVVLVLDDQNFVQTLGNRDALVVEWRTKSEDMMSHYVLGRKGSGKTELQCVAGSAGNSEVVFAREVLDLTDALIIFRAFHEHQTVPDAYHLRDITKRNAARAIAHLSPFGLALLWQGWLSLDAPAAELLERHLSREFPSWRELLVFEGPLTPEYALALLDFAKTQVRTTCGGHIVKGCCSTILIAAVHLRLQPDSMRLRLSCASRIHCWRPLSASRRSGCH